MFGKCYTLVLCIDNWYWIIGYCAIILHKTIGHAITLTCQ